MTQGHSTTLLVYRALPGDVFPRHPPAPTSPHKPPEREPGKEKECQVGAPLSPAARSPSLGSGPVAPPFCPGPQKEALGLEIRSARPCLVSLCFSGDRSAQLRSGRERTLRGLRREPGDLDSLQGRPAHLPSWSCLSMQCSGASMDLGPGSPGCASWLGQTEQVPCASVSSLAFKAIDNITHVLVLL